MIGKAKVVGRPACKREETRREQGTRLGKMNAGGGRQRERPACKKEETRREQGTRLGKMNAGDGDREKDRRTKNRKRGEKWKQGWGK